MTPELINAMVADCTESDIVYLLNAASAELQRRLERKRSSRGRAERNLKALIKTIKENGKIAAIKLHRDQAIGEKPGLKESKDYVESIIDEHNVPVHMPVYKSTYE